MAKMFSVNGQEFTARQFTDAKYAVLPYVNAYGTDGAGEHVSLMLQGEVCTVAEFLQACADAEQARIEKKMQTHVYARVLADGSMGCTYVWRWIRK